MLQIFPTSLFRKDVKRLRKKHADLALIGQVVQLIMENSRSSEEELKRRHNMHKLKGEWKKSLECHVVNTGDWLLVWTVEGDRAYLQRTGTHDEIFRN